MIKPCPNLGCQKPIEVTLAILEEAMSAGGKNLTCPYPDCRNVLWLDRNGLLKSVSEEHGKIEKLGALSVEKERCVILSCDKETPYTKDTPIEKRRHYVRGAGQLCEKCGKKYYPEGGD